MPEMLEKTNMHDKISHYDRTSNIFVRKYYTMLNLLYTEENLPHFSLRKQSNLKHFFLNKR